MKKLILILFLSLGFCINNTQAQEPTKQETMDWIAGKMKQYLTNDYIFEFYDGRIFKYRTKANDGGRVIIDLAKIRKADYGTEFYDAEIRKRIKIEGFELEKFIDFSETPNTVSASHNHRLDETDFNIFADESLPERFMKAINTLIKYNTQKDAGEKF